MTWIAPFGTPSAANAAAIACARANPRVTACCCAPGSVEAASPRPRASITRLPRLPASARSAGNCAGGNDDAPGANSISTAFAGLAAGADADARPAVARVLAGGTGGTLGGLAAAVASGGGAAGDVPALTAPPPAPAGTCPAGAATPVRAGLGGGSAGKAGNGACVAAGGKGALVTAPTGAFCGGVGADSAAACRAGVVAAGVVAAGGAGGAVAAARLADAVLDPDGSACPAPGAGGLAVPTPNNPGEAVGNEGSVNGAAAARCWAFARSAISPFEICSRAAMSGGGGFSGTDARLGYGWFAPGAAACGWEMAPPSRAWNQFAGLSEQAASSAGTASRAHRRSARQPPCRRFWRWLVCPPISPIDMDSGPAPCSPPNRR